MLTYTTQVQRNVHNKNFASIIVTDSSAKLTFIVKDTYDRLIHLVARYPKGLPLTLALDEKGNVYTVATTTVDPKTGFIRTNKPF